MTSKDIFQFPWNFSVFWYYIFLQYWKYPYPNVFPLVFSIFVKLFSRLGVPDQRRYWYPPVIYARLIGFVPVSSPLLIVLSRISDALLPIWKLVTPHITQLRLWYLCQIHDRSRGLPRRRWTGIFSSVPYFFLPV